MDELKLQLGDKKRLLEKEQRIINVFYPNGEDGLSENHIKTYRKLINNINTLTSEIEEIEEQLKEE